jgi:ribosomal protein L19E
VDLGTGRSVHLRPKESADLTDADMRAPDVVRLVAKGLLRVKEDEIPTVLVVHEEAKEPAKSRKRRPSKRKRKQSDK